MASIKSYIRLLRPTQWIKNLFVMLPVFFSGEILDLDRLWPVIGAFLAFCLVASSIYCLNDMIDREADRLHAKKRFRPMASGAVSVAEAWVLMAACLTLAAVLLLLLAPMRWATLAELLGVYLVLNIAYCLHIKRIAIVDLMCVSAGFVLRILVGGVAADVRLSQWIVLMTFLIALFLALAKRRDDVLVYRDTGVLTRMNVVGYTVEYMNMALASIASVTMMCYIMYTVSADVQALHNTEYLYFTSVFVLAGLLRYLQLAIVDNRTGSPTEVVIHDRFLQACVALWLLSFALVIYC